MSGLSQLKLSILNASCAFKIRVDLSRKARRTCGGDMTGGLLLNRDLVGTITSLSAEDTSQTVWKSVVSKCGKKDFFLSSNIEIAKSSRHLRVVPVYQIFQLGHFRSGSAFPETSIELKNSTNSVRALLGSLYNFASPMTYAGNEISHPDIENPNARAVSAVVADPQSGS
jgi:hypothetical protein